MIGFTRRVALTPCAALMWQRFMPRMRQQSVSNLVPFLGTNWVWGFSRRRPQQWHRVEMNMKDHGMHAGVFPSKVARLSISRKSIALSLNPDCVGDSNLSWTFDGERTAYYVCWSWFSVEGVRGWNRCALLLVRLMRLICKMHFAQNSNPIVI